MTDDDKAMEDRQVEVVADYLKGKRITICVSGGIAAIETPKIARQLRRYGAKVRAIMSDAAQKIITPLALEWATGSDVVTELGGKAQHIEPEDAMLVAPATLNTINKMAYGIADNALTSALASAMGRRIPIIVAPAMHSSLYSNPVLQKSLRMFQEDAAYCVRIVEPRLGEGKAKIAKNDDIVARVTRELAGGPLKGKRILIDAGPTRAHIDAVRYLSNSSSGALGIEIAKDLYLRGADVKLVYGPGKKVPPAYLDVTGVETPGQMLEEMVRELTEKDYDAAIFTAAVLDYVPAGFRDEKVRSGMRMGLELVPSPKIIKEVDKVGKKLFKVGFKLEWKKSREELIATAHDALIKNKTHLLVVNDLSRVKEGTHPAYIVTPERGVTEVKDKRGIVGALADEMGRRLNVTYFRTVQDGDAVHGGRYAEMADAGKRLAVLGVIPKFSAGTFGNYSVRERDGFVITARQADKSALREDDLVYVGGIDMERREKHAEGKRKPSSEAVAHYLLYKEFPDAGAIVHAHDDLALKYAAELGVPVTSQDFQCGTLEGAEEALHAMRKGDYIVMKNHGVMARGKDLSDALAKIERYHLLAEGLEKMAEKEGGAAA